MVLKNVNGNVPWDIERYWKDILRKVTWHNYKNIIAEICLHNRKDVIR